MDLIAFIQYYLYDYNRVIKWNGWFTNLKDLQDLLLLSLSPESKQAYEVIFQDMQQET